MTTEERTRLIRRTQGLRRLLEGNTDGRVRAAINDEIAKHEALIAAIDNKTPDELPADRQDEIVAKAPRGIIS